MSGKAVDIIGDDRIEAHGREFLAKEKRDSMPSKAVNLLGDVKVIPSKAASRRGSDMHPVCFVSFL